MEPEKLRKKLNDCKATGKLNLSYMDLPELAPSVIQQIKVSLAALPRDWRWPETGDAHACLISWRT
jgi:hypothetical protein